MTQYHFTIKINRFYNFYYENRAVHSKKTAENENSFRKAGYSCGLDNKGQFSVNLQQFKHEISVNSMHIWSFWSEKMAKKKKKKKKKNQKCHWQHCRPFDDSSKTNATIGFTLSRKTWKPKASLKLKRLTHPYVNFYHLMAFYFQVDKWYFVSVCCVSMCMCVFVRA